MKGYEEPYPIDYLLLESSPLLPLNVEKMIAASTSINIDLILAGIVDPILVVILRIVDPILVVVLRIIDPILTVVIHRIIDHIPAIIQEIIDPIPKNTEGGHILYEGE
ncbi:4630_t:CDS:2, partial [Funneliformis geosporum]